MSSVSITIDGMNAVLENIHLTTSQLTKKIGANIQYAGIECQAQAKINCPVKSGRLRSSIMYKKIDQYSCTVSTNVKYGPYVEFGTKHMRAQPFLYPAYAIGKQHLMQNLRNV